MFQNKNKNNNIYMYNNGVAAILVLFDGTYNKNEKKFGANPF